MTTPSPWQSVVTADGVSLTPSVPGAPVVLTRADLQLLLWATDAEVLRRTEPWTDLVAFTADGGARTATVAACVVDGPGDVKETA